MQQIASTDGYKIRSLMRSAARSSRLEGPATEKQINFVDVLFDYQLGTSEVGQLQMIDVVRFLFGHDSLDSLTKAEASTLINWLNRTSPEQIDPEPEIEAILECCNAQR